jgi:hypothetical protein
MQQDAYLAARKAAADLAIRSWSVSPAVRTQEEVQDWADFWLGWLLIPQVTSVMTGMLTVTDAHGKIKFEVSLKTGGNTMTTTAMTMDDTADITAGSADDHGDPTSDTLSFTGSDNGSVLTLAPGGTGCHIVPVAEGSATVTQTDPASPGLAPLTYDITVGPGPTSQMTGTIAVNVGANVVPPPPPPAGP